MHVLFVHRNFPAQFGHVAAHLVRERGWRCTFASETGPGTVEGIEKVRYRVAGGATERTHYFSRTFENAIWRAAGVYEALKPRAADLRPDLVVGHSGFGSTLFLPELWPETPVVDYFEYYYRAHDSDMDFRPDWPPSGEDVLRARARNAMILLDLEYCAAGYTPTRFQHGLLPETYRGKVRVIHDGVDTSFWRRREVPEALRERLGIGPETRVVTYAARGLESMRGFDVFMRAAKRIHEEYPDVVFLVAGSEEVHYGGDLKRIRERSFLRHVLAQDRYDPDRFRFLGTVPPEVLARVFSLSDLHVYLTVPFVLSWSLLDAMACGCVVLASDTEPVREVIADGENGILRGFFDVEGLARAAVEVLKDPGAYGGLGEAARRTVHERYGLAVVLPPLAAFFEDVAAARL